jgi:hypothetical protein
MNIDRHISTTQITLAVGLMLGLGLAFVVGSAVGSGDFQMVAMIFGAGIAVATLLVLGNNYWMLIPLSLGATFPAIPLGGRAIEFSELAITACTIFFLLRVATRKEKLHLFLPINIPFLVFIAWVGMVFVLNPIGLAMLGSSVGGGRFYLKLGLAFASFFILSNRTYSQRDMRWVFALLIFGAFFGMAYSIAEHFLRGPQLDPRTGLISEGGYSWHQVLSWPALTIAFVIFSRWSPKEVFGVQRPWHIAAYAACLLLVLMSGKRMALLAVLMAPAVSALMFRQLVYVFVASGSLLLLMAFLVVGQGQWFSLPIVAQRTLSWIPGNWDSELQYIEGGRDEWRAELRRVALANISRDPWIGRGFAVDISETLTAVGMQMYEGSVEAQAAAYALGRSWHNTWLGYAADFGIPFSAMQGAILILILVVSAKCFRWLGNRSMLGAFSLYVFIFTVRDLVASWTSGHSAYDAFDRWWMYGILVGIYLQTFKNVDRDVSDRAQILDPVPRFSGNGAVSAAR